MARYCLTLLFLCCFIFSEAVAQIEYQESILQQPSGNYNIGTKKIFIIDSNRRETFSRKKDFRRIYVKVWYPVKTEKVIRYDKYLADYPVEVVADIFKDNGLNLKLIEKLKSMQTFSSSMLTIENPAEKFPVIIFNPGFYFGMPDFYSSMIENLASNGYIVCCINHPYEQPYVELPNGAVLLAKKKAQLAYLQLFLANKFSTKKRDSREKLEKLTHFYLKRLSVLDKAVRRWADDTQCFIDYIAEMNQKDSASIFSIMDLNKMGSLGQSLGGAVSGQLCIINKNIKAGINMDCFQFGDMIKKPLEVPFMLMQSEHYLDWNLGNTIVFNKTKSDFYTLTMKKSKHFVFSDASLIEFVDKEGKTNLIGEVDGFKSIELINKYILDFFNKYILNIESEYLKEDKDDNVLTFKKIKK